MPSVSFHNVSKRFSATQALSELSFVCKQGEVHALLGENGAGKSTLAGLLAGFYLPSAGEIRIADEPVSLHSPQKSLHCGIGVVFQHPLLVPELSVMENLLLGNAWWKMCATKNFLAHYKKLSNILGISIDAQKRVKHLTLGEQQYIEIMRALWHEQKILVFDESTALLSLPEAEQLGRIMQNFAKNGNTILFITHKLRQAITFADRITIIRQGKKVGEISPEAIAKAQRSHNIQQLEHDICCSIFGEELSKNIEHQAQYPSSPKLPSTTNEKAQNIAKARSPVLAISCVTSHEEEQACSINNISFTIYGNEILGIAGIDGHGQKHLAEILAGQRQTKTGTLHLHGQEITELSNAQRQKLGIHYVSEDRLREGLVGSENIALNLQLKNIGLAPFWKYGIAKWKLIQNHAKKIMEIFFIPQEHQTNVAQNLSGGTIQKVILARELNQPKLCVGILHNPTHGLDVKTTKELHEKLRCALSPQRAFVLLSSDMDELLTLSTHLAVMRNGKLSAPFVNNNDAYHKITSLIAMK